MQTGLMEFPQLIIKREGLAHIDPLPWDSFENNLNVTFFHQIFKVQQPEKNTVDCCYNTVEYDLIWNTSLQWLR